MEQLNQRDGYRTPSIRSMKAGEVIAAMGPAHAIYGASTGGGQGDGGGAIGD